MKKIKFMLLSLALLAVVGGALAFKAKYSVSFCTTKAVQINGISTCIDALGVTLKCPNKVVMSTTQLNGQFCTTPTFLVGGVATCTAADGTNHICARTSYNVLPD